MKKETVKLTKGAMQLVDDQCFASVKFAEGVEGEAKKPSLEMLAYSGGIIKNHWYWGGGFETYKNTDVSLLLC